VLTDKTCIINTTKRNDSCLVFKQFCNRFTNINIAYILLYYSPISPKPFKYNMRYALLAF